MGFLFQDPGPSKPGTPAPSRISHGRRRQRPGCILCAHTPFFPEGSGLGHRRSCDGFPFLWRAPHKKTILTAPWIAPGTYMVSRLTALFGRLQILVGQLAKLEPCDHDYCAPGPVYCLLGMWPVFFLGYPHGGRSAANLVLKTYGSFYKIRGT